MTTTEMTFDQRLRSLARKHRRMQDGVVRKMQPDGLITFQPRRAMPKFPMRTLVLIALLLVMFKALLLAWHGTEDYAARLAPLQDGTVIERGLAWVMQPDPATSTLATGFAQILR